MYPKDARKKNRRENKSPWGWTLDKVKIIIKISEIRITEASPFLVIFKNKTNKSVNLHIVPIDNGDRLRQEANP